MFKKYFVSLFLYLLIAVFSACDHGLKPTEDTPSSITGISGMITYQNWPPLDSLRDLRLVVFKNYPPGNILNEVLSENAVVYPGLNETGLPINTGSTTYVLSLKPGVYKYVVVAWQFGPSVIADWRAAGQYQNMGTEPDPTPIIVAAGELLQSIDINVDFNDLPPQPF